MWKEGKKFQIMEINSFWDSYGFGPANYNLIWRKMGEILSWATFKLSMNLGIVGPDL